MRTRVPVHLLIWPALAAALLAAAALVVATRASAATITASYASGHRNVTINDYRTDALGTFTLRLDQADPEPGTSLVAFCIEADTAHSTGENAYRLVPNRLVSPELDYLVWKYGQPGTAEYTPIGGDHDTATALAALAWYYAGATRRGGGAVWANWANGWSPVSPTSPHRWDALPPFGASFPVGLRSGGHDLDAAERRVYQLAVEAAARRGPWTMGPVAYDGTTASVRITGPAGPIIGAAGVRFVARGIDGAVRSDQTVAADATGTASASGFDIAAGGTIEVSMAAPGVHQEWDGSGAVQRMVTATSTQIRSRLDVAPPATTTVPATVPVTVPATVPASTVPVTAPTSTVPVTAPPPTVPPTSVAPLPRRIRLVKSSSDPAYPPAGARFELADATGTVVDAAITNGDGVIDFSPVDPQAHPGPYRVRETHAPPGLRRIERDLLLGPPYSTDPGQPTLISVTNHPLTSELRVLKQLSDPAAGPGDLSGFQFSVERVVDGREMGSATSDVGGRTPPVSVTAGRVRICETGRPAWAEILVDTGCVDTDIDPTAGPIEVVYVNEVPQPTITTRLRDASDGDQLLTATGGVLTDHVTLAGVVPGTTYTLRGELHALTEEGPRPTGIASQLEVVPEHPRLELAMTVEVPPDVTFAVAVMFQELWLDGRRIAAHTDPADPDQTVWMPQIASRARVLDSPIPELAAVGDRAIDELELRGLPPGEWIAELVWHERNHDGTCAATDLVAHEPFEVPVGTTSSSVTVGPVTIEEPWLGSVLVAMQTVRPADAPDADPVVVHTDCDDASQTIWVPDLHTLASTTAGLATDTITVSALPEPFPSSWTVEVAGGLFVHPLSDTLAEQRCTASNTVAEVRFEIDRPGEWVSPGEPHGHGRFSYAEQIVITVDGSSSGTAWTSVPHGCTLEAQTFTALPEPPPAIPPNTPPPQPDPAAPPVPHDPGSPDPSDHRPDEVAGQAPPSSTDEEPTRAPPPASTPPSDTGRGFPIALPRTGSAAIQAAMVLALAALSVGVVVLLWSAAWPWATLPIGRRTPVRQVRRRAD